MIVADQTLDILYGVRDTDGDGIPSGARSGWPRFTLATPSGIWEHEPSVVFVLNAWSAGDPSGDFDGNGTVDTRDVLAFLNVWTAGC